MSQHDNAWFAAYREKNRLWLRIYKRRWHHRTKELRAEYLKAYFLKNIDKIRATHTKNSQKRRLEILGMLGDRCKKCGYKEDYRALQIDHVRSNGKEERKQMSHSWSYTFWKKALAERPQDYQILCANCNWIKRLDKNELWRKVSLNPQ